MIEPAADRDRTTEIEAVAVLLPPLVMKDGDQLTGFGIDLWRAATERLKEKTSYRLVADVNAYRDALRSRRARVGVTPIFYTTALDREFDFSYPILAAGLQVMVRDEGSRLAPAPLRDLLALLLSRSAAMWLGIALVLILVPAHVIWLLDGGAEGGVVPSRSYVPGIFQAMVWAMSALVGGVQGLPTSWPGRVLGLAWMFAGVVFVALYTARLTARLTAEEIRGAIMGPDDLPGKRVGTIEHSTGAAFLREIRAEATAFTDLDAMFQALLQGRVDAVVFGSPALRHFASHQGKGRVKVVGPEINIKEVGFLFQLDDPLRRRVNSELLTLKEDGTYDRLRRKWLGDA